MVTVPSEDHVVDSWLIITLLLARGPPESSCYLLHGFPLITRTLDNLHYTVSGGIYLSIELLFGRDEGHLLFFWLSPYRYCQFYPLCSDCLQKLVYLQAKHLRVSLASITAQCTASLRISRLS